jgi:hypothetical protein
MNKAFVALLGSLATPLIPAGYFAVAYPVTGQRDAISIVGTFVVAYIFAVLAMLVLGVPILLLFSKFKLIRWWSAAGSGAFVGIVLRFAITPSIDMNLDSFQLFMVLGGIAGMVSWVFWRIAVKGVNSDNLPRADA